MYKADLVESVAKKTGATKKVSEECLNAFIETVMETLKKNNDVSIIGFGSFKCVPTKARTGRNPRTGKEIKIPAGKKVKFSVGKSLKNFVSGNKKK